jgi:hypothetical protein
MVSVLKEIFGFDDFSTRMGLLSLARSFSAETFGTFVIVFLGCGCAINFGTSTTDLVRIG